MAKMKTASYKLTDELIKAIRKTAKQDGITHSEVVRRALSRDLGLEARKQW